MTKSKHPCEYILNELSAKGIGFRDLAHRLGYQSDPAIACIEYKLLNCSRLDETDARRLGEALEISPKILMELQRVYDEENNA